ncbi:MAG TPA: DHH family phosphoesterase [Candidatus Aphodocola excrementigallinarum]|uniref:DHH family phosphoesterase n=1 Tax=Candidatus Aphodocola excrementigallinarum TaxID=2840670 RepID=A0A9D1IP54_9FIRM|nr:DHH family phosphoesterase [Candidatus Aphodocola excrementigallinarum]
MEKELVQGEKQSFNKKQSMLVRKRISEFKDTLTHLIEDSNQVYLTTHKNMDYDAIASLGAIGLICRKLKKSPYIVVDQDEYNDLSYDKSQMFKKIEDKFVVVNLDWFNNNKTEKSLLIAVDVNKQFMTPLKNNYGDFDNIIIIDHHDEDSDTIKTKNKLILNDKSEKPIYITSSCSEIMYWLLKQYKVNVKDIDYYSFLLLGIYLDTNKKRKNTFPSTHECISELIDKKGADENKVNEYLSVDFETDRKIQRLVDETKWITIRYAIGIGNEVYTDEEIAKAADYALKYTCEAAIYAGKDKNGNYLVKARSNRGNLDIGRLMYDLNKGGGNKSSAAARPMFIDAATPEEEREKLFREIKDVIYHKRQQHCKRYYIKNKNIKNINKEGNK